MNGRIESAPAMWGVCPICGGVTHALHMGDQFWVLCAVHRMAWQPSAVYAPHCQVDADSERAWAVAAHLLENFHIIDRSQARRWTDVELERFALQQQAEERAVAGLLADLEVAL
jgi:hypothetical protein